MVPVSATVISTNLDIRSKQVVIDCSFITNGGSERLLTKPLKVDSIVNIKVLKVEDGKTIFTASFEHGRYLTMMCDSDAYSAFISCIDTMDCQCHEHSRASSARKDKLSVELFIVLAKIKDELKAKPGVAATLGVLLVFILLYFSPAPDYPKSISLSHQDKIKVCKAYIAELFAKPTSIIEYNGTQNNLIYVKYTRAQDNSTWKFVCDLSGGTISWAGWQADINQWGRWRSEDEIPYYYSDSGDSVYFTLNNRSSRVAVRL